MKQDLQGSVRVARSVESISESRTNHVARPGGGGADGLRVMLLQILRSRHCRRRTRKTEISRSLMEIRGYRMTVEPRTDSD